MTKHADSLHFIALGLIALALAASAAGAGEIVSGHPGRNNGGEMNPPRPANAAVQASPALGEDQPLVFQGDAHRPLRQQERARGATLSFPSLVPIIMFVLFVCGLFFGVLYLAKKYLPGHRQLFSHPAMEVLGRTHLDQRRYVSLLRVGKRIIVVGVSPDELHSLAEITEESEVTEILEVARPRTEMGLNLFQRLFQRTVIEQDKTETEALAQAKAEQLAEQMSSLRERVKAIRESEEPAHRRLDAIG